MRRRLLAPFLAIGLLLVAPLVAFADQGDGADAAIALVRERLTRNGLPAGGPMVAAPIAHGYLSQDIRPGWFVLTDAGLYIAWSGDAVGPLSTQEADIVERACLCDADLVVLPPPSPVQARAAAAKNALYSSRTDGPG